MAAYYALWTNRNGQHHWSGPHVSEEAAASALRMMIDCQSPVIARKIPARRREEVTRVNEPDEAQAAAAARAVAAQVPARTRPDSRGTRRAREARVRIQRRAGDGRPGRDAADQRRAEARRRMNGPQHFAEAQRLLDADACEYGCPHSGCRHERRLVERAQAHATLAHAAATLFPYHDEPEAEAEWKEWVKAMTPA